MRLEIISVLLIIVIWKREMHYSSLRRAVSKRGGKCSKSTRMGDGSKLERIMMTWNIFSEENREGICIKKIAV